MSVWKRVRTYAKEEVNIIHGKASHEETMATSKAIAKNGHYLVVNTFEAIWFVITSSTAATKKLAETVRWLLFGRI